MRSLSEHLNNQIQKAADDDQKIIVTGNESFASTPSELFKQMDPNGAGNIAFYDFAVMVRKELRVLQADMDTGRYWWIEKVDTRLILAPSPSASPSPNRDAGGGEHRYAHRLLEGAGQAPRRAGADRR